MDVNFWAVTPCISERAHGVKTWDTLHFPAPAVGSSSAVVVLNASQVRRQIWQLQELRVFSACYSRMLLASVWTDLTTTWHGALGRARHTRRSEAVETEGLDEYVCAYWYKHTERKKKICRYEDVNQTQTFSFMQFSRRYFCERSVKGQANLSL
jgi:hypothetical protein